MSSLFTDEEMLELDKDSENPFAAILVFNRHDKGRSFFIHLGRRLCRSLGVFGALPRELIDERLSLVKRRI